MSSAARLLLLTSGKRISQIVHVVATLRIADHLADGPRTAKDLAEVTETDAAALRRLLCAATSIELVEEHSDGAFGLTGMSELLREDNPAGILDIVLFNGEDFIWRSYGEIVHTVRTGEPAFEYVYGRPFFEYLNGDPESGRRFDHAMTHVNRINAAGVLERIRPERFASIADVGAGGGISWRLCSSTPRTPAAFSSTSTMSYVRRPTRSRKR